jgi:ABC-type branched-subunit amino acid transport system substrate-binding protein
MIRLNKIGALALAAGFSLSLTAAAGRAEDAPGVTKDSVTIGSWMSLSGPVAVYGVPLRAGADAYFNALNDKGGVNGRKINFIVEDNAYNPQQTIAAARKLITRDNVLALTITHGTAQTAATFPFVIEENKVPVLLPYGQTINWYQPNPIPGILGLHVLYEAQVEAVGRLAAQDGHKKVLVVHGAHAAFEAVAKYAEPGVKAINPEATAELLAVKMGTSDYAPVVRDVISKKPDAVIAIITLQELSQLAKGLRQQGSDLPIYTYGPNVSNATIELGGEFVEGLKAVSLTVTPTTDSPAMQEYRADLAKYAPDQKPDFGSLLGYGAAKVFAAGLAQSPEPLTRQSLLEGFYKLKGYDSGIFPPVSFAPDKPMGGSILFPLVVKSGAWAPAGDPIDTSAFAK